ncbi:MAG: ABC transporter permease subunit [Clostridia bacterium]
MENNSVPICAKRRPNQSLWLHMKKSYMLYLFLLPSLLFVILLRYAPIYGIQIAFKDFNAAKGIWGSPWVGLKHFEMFFTSFRFGLLLKNTLTISLYTLVAGFPLPIILALMFNYIRHSGLKKFAQPVSYAPHFISTVILVGMLTMFFSPSTGFVNTIREGLGLQRLHYFGMPGAFSHLYVWSGIWQNAGWSAVIYIATLSGIDQSQHEAAIIDGANILQRIRYIDWPALIPTVVILLIMEVGSVMGVGYEKVYLMQNATNLTSSEIISTYTYKIGLEQGAYSYSAAIDLFNNVINFVLLVSVNKLSKLVSGIGLW